MYCDYTLPKPVSLNGYELHQLVEQAFSGSSPLFRNQSDHVLVRAQEGFPYPSEAVVAPKEGAVHGFKLKSSCGSKCKGRHKYFSCDDHSSRRSWLSRKAANAGFEVLTVSLTANPRMIEKPDRKFSIDETDFMGVLRVTNEDLFTRTLFEGLSGPGRAFGNNLLLI